MCKCGKLIVFHFFYSQTQKYELPHLGKAFNAFQSLGHHY
jgi:hypothetical protein